MSREAHGVYLYTVEILSITGSNVGTTVFKCNRYVVCRMHCRGVVPGLAFVPWKFRVQSDRPDCGDVRVIPFHALANSRMPPGWMIDVGKQASEFFEKRREQDGQKTYRFKSIEQYSREHNTTEQPSKKYFRGTLLPEIIQGYDRDKSSSSTQKQENQTNG